MSEDNGNQETIPDLKDNSEVFKKKEDEAQEKPAPPDSTQEKPDPDIRQMVITFNIKKRGTVVSGFIKDPMICLYMLNDAEDQLKGYWGRMIYEAMEADRVHSKMVRKGFLNRVKGAFGK